jgi:preprotein translocase subunit SecG
MRNNLKRMIGLLSAVFLSLSLSFTAACQYESGPYGSGEDGKKKKEELYLLYILLLAQSKKSESGGSGSSGSAY